MNIPQGQSLALKDEDAASSNLWLGRYVLFEELEKQQECRFFFGN
ncbi:MAG: hypothetical protein N2035_04430 [Chthoniobacterales bacterium]|nr:hypothetical protein [Chthoniobacterales bacterium]